MDHPHAAPDLPSTGTGRRTSLPACSDRLIEDLRDLRRIGAMGRGVARVAFSDSDIAARRWLAGRIEEAGLTPVVDACGNLFGLPPGEGPMLLVGSHSDTQPLGGWLDGAYGVICGLELARMAVEAGGPRIAVVSFQDEEGRFGGLTGSAVWAGRVPLPEVDLVTDHAGVTFGEARDRAREIAPVGEEVPPSLFRAYIEPHIEQGPVLDTEGCSIGVVEAIVGVRQFDLRFEGEANHAGTTPMSLRRDAVRGLARFMQDLDAAFAPIVTERTVWTLGRIVVEPNESSIIPQTASVTVQIRDAETRRLDCMASLSEEVARAAAADLGLSLQRSGDWNLDPTPMDARLAGALALAAETIAPGRWCRMTSGALHDASNVAAVLPSVMLFVPSLGGISHNPREDTQEDDLRLGLEVLSSFLASC